MFEECQTEDILFDNLHLGQGLTNKTMNLILLNYDQTLYYPPYS